MGAGSALLADIVCHIMPPEAQINRKRLLLNLLAILGLKPLIAQWPQLLLLRKIVGSIWLVSLVLVALEDFHLADGRPDHSLRRVPLDINVPRRRSVHTYRLVADIRLMDSRQRA